MNDTFAPRSALRALRAVGGHDVLWSVPSPAFLRAGILLERVPTIRQVQRLVSSLASVEEPSVHLCALTFLAVGHACRSHPMVLLAPSGSETVEETVGRLAEGVLAHLDASPANLAWEGAFAPLALQSAVYDGLLELERLLRRLAGVGPDWEGPSPDALAGAARRLSAAVAQLYPLEDGEGRFLAPALAQGLRPLPQRTSAPAHALAGRILEDHLDLEEDLVRSVVAPTQIGGYGVRSLSALDPAFDPARPGSGAVDPLETALAARGLEDLGMQALARVLWTRLTCTDRPGFPRALPGGPAEAEGVVVGPDGRHLEPSHPVTVAVALAARRALGGEVKRRRLGEDLPPGPLESSLLAALDEPVPCLPYL